MINCRYLGIQLVRKTGLSLIRGDMLNTDDEMMLKGFWSWVQGRGFGACWRAETPLKLVVGQMIAYSALIWSGNSIILHIEIPCIASA